MPVCVPIVGGRAVRAFRSGVRIVGAAVGDQGRDRERRERGKERGVGVRGVIARLVRPSAHRLRRVITGHRHGSLPTVSQRRFPCPPVRLVLAHR